MAPIRRKRCRKQNRHRFTLEECRKGYQAALEKCSHDWELLAWLCERVRRQYRRKRKP